MKKGIRWGILGPGKIAITFAEAVNLIGEDVIVAVASHDERKAAAFAAEHQIAHGYGSYEELVSRDDIDAVYVSNLHMMHRDAALMAMRHGKCFSHGGHVVSISARDGQSVRVGGGGECGRYSCDSGGFFLWLVF